MSDIVMIILALGIVLCPALIYWNNYNNAKKFKAIHFNGDLSGFEIAEKILQSNGFDNLYIVETKNYLEECYDTNRNVIRLLPSRFHGLAISDGIKAAFLAGHAIFDKKNKALHIRNLLLPIVNLLIYVCYGCIILAAFIKNYDYLKLGILGLFIIVLFHLITLPIEKEMGQFIIKNIRQLDLLDETYNAELIKLTDGLIYRYLSSPLNLIIAVINLLKNK